MHRSNQPHTFRYVFSWVDLNTELTQAKVHVVNTISPILHALLSLCQEGFPVQICYLIPLFFHREAIEANRKQEEWQEMVQETKRFV